MPQIYLAFHGALAVLRQQSGRWTAELTMVDQDYQCLAVDPHRPQRVYCGTFAAGLAMSDDAGLTWQPVAGKLPYAAIMSVTVSPLEEVGGVGVVWAGTEPSALFRSEDSGRTWQERPGLQDLPSKPTWSFPPRPWTHHVRWIEPDATIAERLFVGIELGGVMRSLDGGQIWEDRQPGSQYDCHTLRTHPQAGARCHLRSGRGRFCREPRRWHHLARP